MLTDAILVGDVVYNQEVPVIIKQTIDNETAFTALAKDRNVQIACAGCFKADMRITDSTRCKKCASFVKHWDVKDGQRHGHCKETGFDIKKVAANCDRLTIVFTVNKGNENTLEATNTSDLIAELKRRG